MGTEDKEEEWKGERLAEKLWHIPSELMLRYELTKVHVEQEVRCDMIYSGTG